VTDPESAVERARQSAAARRAQGAYPEPVSTAQPEPESLVSADKLLQWALIEPDVRNVRSTRRLGAPITALKRVLLRLLSQYHDGLIAEQSRFNAHLLITVLRLQDRVEQLEQRLPREGGER